MELAYNRPFQHVNDPKEGIWLSSSSRQSVHWHELADAVRRCYDVDGQGDACGPSSIWPPDPKNLRPWRKQPAVLFFTLDLACRVIKQRQSALCVTALWPRASIHWRRIRLWKNETQPCCVAAPSKASDIFNVIHPFLCHRQSEPPGAARAPSAREIAPSPLMDRCAVHTLNTCR